MKAPFIVNVVVTLGLIAGCLYFWVLSDNPGKFVASAFLLIGLAQFGTHAAMDIAAMRRK